MELAAQESPGIRISAQADQDIFSILCAALGGGESPWPAVSSDTFYSRFLELAAYHGVDLLAWHLAQERGDTARLPGWVKEELAARTARAVAVELVRANDIRSLQQHLAQAGIAAILIKGGALAYTHYPAPYLRSRADTDIFIRPDGIRIIRDVFRKADYRLEGWIYKSHQFKALREGFGGQAIKYDVHWRSSNHPRYARVLSHDAARAGSVTISELGGIAALSPVHALLQACVHRAAGAYHDPNRLIWLYDVHLLITGMSECELKDFADMAVRSGVNDICLEAVRSAGRLFGTDLAEPAMQVLGRAVTAGEARSRAGSSQLALIIDDLRELPDFQGRLELIKEYFFPSSGYLLQRYGKTGAYWVPLLYVRYVIGGTFGRISLN